MERHLDIESDEAAALADELTALTGKSVTDAVVRALRERLQRARDEAPRRKLTEAERKQMIADARKITAEIRAHLTKPISSDHGWLYGEDGLPK